MTISIAINGYGRVGRNIVRALYEAGRTDEIRLAAINSTTTIENAAHLTRYDSTHGRFAVDVRANGTNLVIGGDPVHYFCERDPAKLPWGEVGVDLVCECTGKFKTKEEVRPHLESGARKVLISAPGGDDMDATIVYGVNHEVLQAGHTVVSNASCTTNCLAPPLKVLHRAIGVKYGLITTIHAYTNDQVLIDSPHRDIRRARSATMSVVPTKTGAAKAVGLVLPELAGKLHGHAMRVPTINVSIVDLTFTASRPTSREEVSQVIRTAAKGELKGILQFCDEPLVSVDFNHHPASCIYDATLTQVMQETLVKVSLWYDNEWGYSNRMMDTALAMMHAK